MYEQKVTWYRWQEGTYQPITSDEQGVLHSQVLPGLWLDPARFWAGDLAGVLSVLRQGLASPEHADFVRTLQARAT